MIRCSYAIGIAISAIVLSVWSSIPFRITAAIPQDTIPNKAQRAILGLLNLSQNQALEPLLKALKTRDSNLRFQAAWALGRLRDFENPVITDALLSALEDEDPWVRNQTIETLALREEFKAELRLRKDDRVRNSFLGQAKSRDPYIRSAALKGLRLWRAEPDVKAVFRRGQDDQVWLVRNASTLAGPEDIESLKEAIQDEYPYSRMLAIRYLAKFYYSTNPEITDLLIERLRDPVSDVVIEAAHGLSTLEERRAVKPILDLLNLDWKGLVGTAVYEITGKSLEEEVKDQAWKPNPHFKLDAYVSQPSETEFSTILKRSEKGDSLERISAVLELVWFNNTARIRPVFESAANDLEPRVRFAVLDGLETRARFFSRDEDYKLANDIAFLLLSDRSPYVKRAAIRIAAGLRKEKLTEEREKILSNTLLSAIGVSEDPFVRAEAVKGLELVKHGTDLQELLIKLAGDEFYEVRHNALTKLDLLSFPKGIDTVITALKDPVPAVRLLAVYKVMSKDNKDVFANQSKVIKALQNVSLNDSEGQIRETAANALRQIDRNKHQ